MAFEVRVDVRDVVEAFRKLRAEAPRPIMRAVNRTMQQVQTVAVRELSRDTGLPQHEIRRGRGEGARYRGQPAMVLHKATVGDLRASLVVVGDRIPLIRFRARGPEPSRGKGRGVTYHLGRLGTRRARHAFIATMRSGHRGVFLRTSTSRLPIVQLYGPSLPRVFALKEREMRAVAEQRMPMNLTHEIEFLLRGRRGAA